MLFNNLPVGNGVKDAVAAMGYEEATPIQAAAIPLMLEGRDVIGRARTGTGKTAAFGIPLIEHLRGAKPGVQGLVLCPTRELALQVTEVLQDIARGGPVKVLPVYGGTGFAAQTKGLQQRTPLVVVACPGRLLDLVGQGACNLGTVQFLILDEADRMLDMGFIHDMKRILKLLPERRQTGLFSATLDPRVRKLAHAFLDNPETVEAEDGATATPLTEQYHIRVEVPQKSEALLSLLHQETPGKAVVFTRTKHLARRMAQKLNKQGWSSVALQGNMSQNQRERAMEAFRAGDARILVATDVAARGLDVPDITHVVNFDLPTETENYVHRIGRTGRNGRTGRSFTFVQSNQHRDLRAIESHAGDRIPVMTLDLDAEAPRGPDQPHNATPPRPPATRQTPDAGTPHNSRSNSGTGRRRRRGPRRNESFIQGSSSGPRQETPARRSGNGPQQSRRTNNSSNGGARRSHNNGNASSNGARRGHGNGNPSSGGARRGHGNGPRSGNHAGPNGRSRRS